MIPIPEKNLNTLIRGLTTYKDNGVIDPWVLSDNSTIEPLDVLLELKKLRDVLYSECECEDPSCPGMGYEGEVEGHLVVCPCAKCKQEMGKI